MANQLLLFDVPARRLTHGGLRRSGHRKVRRPLFARKAIHLVLKASGAYGRKSLWHKHHRHRVEKLICAKARENSVKLLEAVNMGNHIHLKIRIADRKSFQRFLRTITGVIARIVLKAERGRPHPGTNCESAPCANGGHFWTSLAYTRVLTTALEELHLRGYFEANRIERRKGRSSRERMLGALNAWVQNLRKKSRRKNAPGESGNLFP